MLLMPRFWLRWTSGQFIGWRNSFDVFPNSIFLVVGVFFNITEICSYFFADMIDNGQINRFHRWRGTHFVACWRHVSHVADCFSWKTWTENWNVWVHNWVFTMNCWKLVVMNNLCPLRACVLEVNIGTNPEVSPTNNAWFTPWELSIPWFHRPEDFYP